MTYDLQSAMQTVLESQPYLQNFGFGVYDSRNKSIEQVNSEIESGRILMLSDRSLDQFKAAREWLKQFPKIKHPNPRGTSYGLKHIAENAIGYCTNGVFIAAALAEGFEIEREINNSPNARINISSKAWGKRW